MQPLKASYRAAAAVARAIPPGLRYRIGTVGGRLWYWGSWGQARNTRNNYSRILGLPPSHPDVRRRARLAYEYHGEMLFDFLITSTLSPDEVLEQMDVQGREIVDRALEKGKGVIITLPHMGNYDLAAAAAAVLGYRVYAIAVRFPGSLDEAVIEERARFGMNIIPLDKSAFAKAARVLRENAVLALMTDIAHTGKGVDVEMFGSRASVPAGPAVLSLRTGAALIPGSVRRIAPGRYQARVEPPVEIERTGDLRKDTASLSQAVVRRFEASIRESPENWFAFRSILKPA